jgi:hypothetical protein
VYTRRLLSLFSIFSPLLLYSPLILYLPDGVRSTPLQSPDFSAQHTAQAAKQYGKAAAVVTYGGGYEGVPFRKGKNAFFPEGFGSVPKSAERVYGKVLVIHSPAYGNAHGLQD